MLILGGIISGSLFTSVLSILKYLADPYDQLPAIVYWLMGGLSMADSTTTLAGFDPDSARVVRADLYGALS